MPPKESGAKTGLEGAIFLEVIKCEPEATISPGSSPIPTQILTRYDCGCRIYTNHRTYRITYCNKHKAAPDMYEALVKFPRETASKDYTVEEMRRLIRKWCNEDLYMALSMARSGWYDPPRYRCKHCRLDLTEEEVTAEGSEKKRCPSCHSGVIIRQIGCCVVLIKKRLRKKRGTRHTEGA